jgi:hypothetical protein
VQEVAAVSDEKNERPEPTLTEFIDSNQKLISTFAIFAGLSAFANGLPNKDAAKTLSFFLFILALLVGVEIIGNFKLAKRPKLHLFQEVFSATVLTFGLAWVYSYYPYLFGLLLLLVMAFVFLLVYALCGAAIRRTVSRLVWPKGTSERVRDQYIPVFGSMLLMTLALFSLRYIGVLVRLWRALSGAE